MMQPQDAFQQPEFVNAAIQRGIALFNEGRFDSAETVFAMAAQAPDTRHFVQHMRGLIADRLGKREEAKRLLREAIELRPEVATAHANLGKMLLDDGQAAHAVAAFAAALGLKADLPASHFSLACALEEARLPELAAAGYLDALALLPDRGAELNLSRVLCDLGRAPEAAARLRGVLETHPDDVEAHAALAFCLLAAGDWEGGWREYEWRLRDPGLVQDPLMADRPRWNGEDLSGKTLLLQSEQGLGDSLQCLRFAPLLKDRGCRLRLRIQRALMPLIPDTGLFETVTSTDEPPPVADLHVPLLSLPGLLGARPDTLPPPLVPLVDAALAERWRGRVDAHFGAAPSFTVGLCWQGNPTQQRDRPRSIPFALLAPLLDHPGVRFVSLQVAHGVDQLDSFRDRVFDAGAEMDPASFADAAALVSTLDLVITIDSAIAHLAGSLGRPTWVLLSTAADWRWPRGAAESGWYPSARLFHQPKAGRWGETVIEAAKALAELAPGWDSPPKRVPAPSRSVADGVLADALFVEGCRHHEAGTADRARHFYDAALASDPDHRESLCNLAALLTAEGDFVLARDAAERAVRLAPGRPLFRRVLADTLRQSGATVAAIGHYRRALEQAPRDALIHGGLALALQAAGDLDKALTHFQRASELNPRQPADFFCALGETLSGLDRLEGAERAYQAALAVDPDCIEAHAGLDGIRAMTGRLG